MKSTPVTVLSNKRIAPHCFRMVLSGISEEFDVEPGRFIMLRVGDRYDPLLRRPFAAYVTETMRGKALEIFYAVVGYGTGIMSGMTPDTRLEVLGPLGNGFTIPDPSRRFLIVAGGMGIVPLRGLTHRLIDTNCHNIHVFAGAKTKSHLLFEEELKTREISFHPATDDGSTGYHGFVTDRLDRFLAKDLPEKGNGTVCFACGPSAMLEAVAGIADRYGIPCQVSLESRMACGIGVCLGCAVKLRNHRTPGPDNEYYGRVCVEGPVFESKDLVWPI